MNFSDNLSLEISDRLLKYSNLHHIHQATVNAMVKKHGGLMTVEYVADGLHR